MRKVIFFGLFFSSGIAIPDAATIMADDSTQATAAISDTSGCCIVVRHKGHGVRIEKKQILWIISDNDTVFYHARKCRDSQPKEAGPVARVSVNSALAKIIAKAPVQKARLVDGCAIAYEKQPIALTGGEGALPTLFSNAMVPFLKKHGPVRMVSKVGMFFSLSGTAAANHGCKYLAVPVTMAVRSKDRTMNISTFVKLDSAGNFTPAKTGATLKAREKEYTVRFVIFDLSSRAIVFDEQVKHCDKGLKEIDSLNSKDTQNSAAANSILRIQGRIAALLKRQFKKLGEP